LNIVDGPSAYRVVLTRADAERIMVAYYHIHDHESVVAAHTPVSSEEICWLVDGGTPDQPLSTEEQAAADALGFNSIRLYEFDTPITARLHVDLYGTTIEAHRDASAGETCHDSLITHEQLAREFGLPMPWKREAIASASTPVETPAPEPAPTRSRPR
jgi:hypothetical protein